SRSSNSATANMEDLVGPMAVNITTCGTLIVKKLTSPSPDPGNTVFPFVADAPSSAQMDAPSPQLTGEGGPEPLSTATTTLPHPFNLHNNETEQMQVGQGTNYRVIETVPRSWQLTTASCDNGSGTLVTLNTSS